MLLVFILELLLLWAIVLRLGMSAFEPMPTLLMSWSMASGLLALGIFHFERIFVWTSFSAVSLAVLAFSLGALVVRARFFASRRDIRDSVPKPSRVYTLWVGLSSVFAIGYLMIVVGRLIELGGVLRIIGNLSAVRTLHWQAASPGIVSVSDLFLTLCRPFAISSILLFPYSVLLKRRVPIVIGLLSSAGVALETLEGAGRGLFVTVCIGAVYVYGLIRTREGPMISRKIRHRYSRLLRDLVLVIVAAGMSYVLFAWFPAARNPGLESNFGYYLHRLTNASVTDGAENLSHTLGDHLIQPIYFSISYFTAPIPTLTFFYLHSDVTDWYQLGRYDFPIVTKSIDLLRGKQSSWEELRARLAKARLSAGLSENPWATIVRDLTIDFGVFGTIVFMFLMGSVHQAVYDRAFGNPAFEYLILFSLLSQVVLFSAFSGLLYTSQISYPLFLGIGFLVLGFIGRKVRVPVRDS